MSTQVKRRVGSTAQHTTFTGAAGEITIDTTKNTAVVHDGSTAGGYPLSKEGHTHVIAALPVAADGVSSSTSVVRADDTRLSNARTPAAHVHAGTDISSGTVAIARLPVASDGTSSSTSVVRADDTRLSNARTPASHTHPQSEITSLTTDLAGKQPLDGDLTAIAALATNGLAERTGTNTWAIRAIGSGASTSVPDLAAADARYVQQAVDANLASRQVSGIYRTTSATKANGWPADSGSFIASISTAGSTSDYHSMQVCQQVGTQELWIRAVNITGATTGATNTAYPWVKAALGDVALLSGATFTGSIDLTGSAALLVDGTTRIDASGNGYFATGTLQSDYPCLTQYDTNGTTDKRRYQYLTGADYASLAGFTDAGVFVRNLWIAYHDGTFNVATGPLQVAGQTVASTAGNHQLRSYTVGTLPSATTAGQMIYVSNETGGAVPAFSDGTNWRRVTDRAIVA